MSMTCDRCGVSDDQVCHDSASGINLHEPSTCPIMVAGMPPASSPAHDPMTCTCCQIALAATKDRDAREAGREAVAHDYTERGLLAAGRAEGLRAGLAALDSLANRLDLEAHEAYSRVGPCQSAMWHADANKHHMTGRIYARAADIVRGA